MKRDTDGRNGRGIQFLKSPLCSHFKTLIKGMGEAFNFSKANSTVTLYSKFISKLTFQNFYSHFTTLKKKLGEAYKFSKVTAPQSLSTANSALHSLSTHIRRTRSLHSAPRRLNNELTVENVFS